MPYQELPPESEMPEVFGEWLNWLSLHKKGVERTITAYNQGVRRVISFAGFPPSQFGPAAWTDEELLDTVRRMMDDGEMSASTHNLSLAALKSFFCYCRANDLVDTVPNVFRIIRLGRRKVAHQEPEHSHLHLVGESVANQILRRFQDTDHPDHL